MVEREALPWSSLPRVFFFLRIEALNCEKSTRRARMKNRRFTMTSGRRGVFEYDSPRTGIGDRDLVTMMEVIAYAKSLQRLLE